MAEINAKLIKARVQLQKENPFFSYVCMHLDLIEENEKVPTMGVDKYGHCYYNDKFVTSLDVDEVKGVLCHEVMHIILEHLRRLSGRDPFISNIAQDIVVNDLIITNHFTLPQKEDFKGWMTDSNHCIQVGRKQIKDVNKKVWEEVYEEIEKMADKVKGDSWDKHIREEQGEGQGQGKDGDGKGKEEKKLGQGSGKEEEKNWKQIISEAYAYSKLQGKTPMGMDRYIDELNNPKLPWRQLLQKYILQQIPYDFTYSRPSKKSIVTGVFIPAIKKEQLEIAVAIDTSGSMSEEDLQDCLSEVLGIVSAYDNVELTVLTCDADVHTVKQVRSLADAKSIKMKGGGGTDFRPVFKWLGDNKPNLKLLLFFTDGYGEFPTKETVQTIWILSKDSVELDDIPFGDSIKVGGDRDED